MSWTRLAVVAGLGTLVGACGGPAESVSSSSASASRACGQLSWLGQAVLNGANSAPSTVPRVNWSYNSVVSQPIIGGQAFAAAASQLISSARHEVIIESFIIDDTWITGQVANAIAQLDPSIPVYVLFTTDTTSTVNLQTDETMANHVLSLLDPSASHNVIVANWDGRIDINHDKSIVVDRESLLISNINMEQSADPTWASSNGNDWYQMGVVLQGEIAGVAASEATGAWTHAGAVVSSRPGAATSYIPGMTSPGGTGCVPMLALGREVSAGESSSSDQAFVSLFTNAQHELHIQTPNLNDDGALGAIVQATNNADVYLVLSEGFTGWTEDLPGEGGSNVNTVQSRLPSMLQSAGNACRLHVRWYATPDNPGVAVDGTGVDGASHAKFASADSQFMIIGSQNMDTQSWKVSREFNVGIDDPATTGTFDAAFSAVWNRSPCAYECGGCSAQPAPGGDAGPAPTADGGGGPTADGGSGSGGDSGGGPAPDAGGGFGGDAGAGFGGDAAWDAGAWGG